VLLYCYLGVVFLLHVLKIIEKLLYAFIFLVIKGFNTYDSKIVVFLIVLILLH